MEAEVTRSKQATLSLHELGATTGKAFLIQECPEAVFASYLMRLRTKPGLLPKFLNYYLQTSEYWSHIDSQKGGRLKGGVNIPILESLEIPLPSPLEQRAIARALEAVQKAKEARQRELALERERKAALMEYLFTHGTRGEPTKQTEIGEVPQNWEIHAFDAVAEVKSGQVDPRNELYASMPHIGPENIEPETGRLLPTKTAKELKLISGKYLFTGEDVLYSKIRPYLKKVALPNFTGVCSADMYPLRPKSGVILRDFLYHYLLTESFTIRAVGFQMRTGIPKINREQLGVIPVPVPSITEQQEIARALNTMQTKITTLEQAR